MSTPVRLEVNGRAVELHGEPMRRLSDALREELDLLGTKVGCEAGDCGACTVLLDGAQVCACMVPVGRLGGRRVTTVEGLAPKGSVNALQAAFERCGATQCGICTPGMLIAAAELLARIPHPSETEVMDALSGVLCRCTGYRQIVAAVLAAADGVGEPGEAPAAGAAVGARIARVDGRERVTGGARYGADEIPPDALWMRVVRSPHAQARFEIGNTAALHARHPGLVRVLAARDVPGRNGFGIYPTLKDQPVLADGEVRYRGEAVLALVGEPDTIRAIDDTELPIVWHPEAPVIGVAAALAAGAPAVQAIKPDNVLARGYLCRGDSRSALAAAAHVAEGSWQTPFVEHAYIEPEAGIAWRRGNGVEIWVTTQAPYMDRAEVAGVLGIEAAQVRIIPSACGGGFGGKLDVSVQPLIGLAAWLLDRPVRCVYTRPESMASSTKRHPARIHARAACDAGGRVTALELDGDFDTGAYASWGPTVADRVPVHASGPYRVPNVTARTRAVLTNAPPSGAFRGFGVPQGAIVQEALFDMLAEQAGIDPLEFRLRNALRAGDVTASGQVLEASVGLAECLESLRGRWDAWREAARQYNAEGHGALRRGVGIGCMWYGCGNTSMSNPSIMRIGISRTAQVTLYNGAVDIGQGANTVMAQIAADALGVEVARIGYVMGDTARTADAGKSSASRQTFVSGKAVERAGRDLREQILRGCNAGPDARIEFAEGRITVLDDGVAHAIDLASLPERENGDVLIGSGTFDPPTAPLDENGQGKPYATYGFAAQIAEVEVDIELGTVRARRIAAAHDVGRAVNPMQVEGQIIGGIAQGLGLALMEEYLPGRTENLHDYLIPTIGDIPEVEIVIVEDREPLGPYGAKGIGEPALIPTPPALLGAIHHATGARIHRVPATPAEVLAALRAAHGAGR